METRTLRLEAQRRLAADTLKCCPLCGAINALSNAECFVCRWHGDFVHDPHQVELGLGELLKQCPELADAMVCQPAPRPTRWQRLCRWVRAHIRRRVDFRV